MNNPTPEVSVVMSVYNGENYIRESIDSILNQTFIDYEFIIIDDGSTDSTSKILDQYSKLNPCIRLIKHKNIGLTKSLIVGCNEAKGKYIARQDADDFSYPTRLKEEVSMLNNNEKIILVGTWYTVTYQDSSSVLISYSGSDSAIRRDIFYKNPFCHSSVMFDKKTYDSLSGYNPNYKVSQDLDLWFKMLSVGKAGIVKKNLVKRSIHENCISKSKLSRNQAYNSFKIRKKYLATIDFNASIFTLYIALIYQIVMMLVPNMAAKRISAFVSLIKK